MRARRASPRRDGPARGRGRGRARGRRRDRAAGPRAVSPTTGRFLFSLVAPQAGCEVLELGGSRGYSSIWLASGARILGGRVLSFEHDPRKAEAGGERRRGRARRMGRARRRRRPRSSRGSTTRSTSSSSTRRRRITSASSSSPARGSSRAGWSSPTTCSRTPRRSVRTPRRARPTRRSSSVTVPLDRGLEFRCLLR